MPTRGATPRVALSRFPRTRPRRSLPRRRRAPPPPQVSLAPEILYAPVI